MIKLACVGAILFLFAGLANAQLPGGNIFFGYSYENTNSSTLDLNLNRANLNGWEASFEGKLLPWVGLVADVAGHYGSQDFVEDTPIGPLSINVTGHQQEYLFGPRLSVPVGRLRPFAEVMVGLAHIHTGGTLPGPSNTSFASAYGGGLDYRLFGPLALRGGGDYIRTNFFNTHQDNVRLSFGAVFRF